MDASQFFGLTENEVRGVERIAEKYERQDGRVCICGHTLKSHSDGTYTQGILKCQALKGTCACRNPRGVIRASNGRYFLKKTHGSGAFHALAQGVSALIQAGGSVEWIVSQKCDRCGIEGLVAPTVMRLDGRIAPPEIDTGIHNLLCRSCRGNIE